MTEGMGDNYGADRANTESADDPNVLGGTDNFNYLALRDHVGPSGVPLGGIGVGCFGLAPDGRFTRIGLNNIQAPPKGEGGRGSFFSVWQKSDAGTSARRLVRDDETICGMRGYKHSTYTGLFPRAKVWFDDGPGASENVSAVIHAYSGLVPHNVKDSALPVVWFEVTLSVKEAAEVSVAFSWQDFLGHNLNDPESLEGLGGQILSNPNFWSLDGENWPNIQQVPTGAKDCRIGNLRGVLQFTKQPWQPKKLTFQNYVTQVALLAEAGADSTISMLPAYEIGKDQGWESFLSNGTFSTAASETALSSPDGSDMATAVAVKARLGKGEQRVVRFVIAWYYPVMDVDRETADPASFWATGDYGRWFHNYFDSLEDLVAYAAKERERILAQTIEWQTPVLESTWPDWLKFKTINNAHTMYTNTILNKAGDFTVLEGGMAGLAGTMDQRISAHPFYQKFFTELDRSEMDIFADCQDPEGYILHFIGHYYVGMSPRGGPAPTEKSYMLDNTGGWVIQLAKDCAQTGDIEYLKRHADGVRKAMAHLKSKIPDGRQIPVGSTTYDDFRHPPVYSYMAGMYITILKAAVAIGEMLGDQQMVAECTDQIEKTREDMIKTLWNGRFFSYGCELDGSDPREHIMFTGQLGGQFVSRYCGWGDIIPLEMVRAAILAQFKTSLANTPDYYANKVWDINEMRGIDSPGSQCWPFYLESYTAMTGIQAGYLDDGLDIMKHIQLVHTRQGWTWCQKLWRPGELTYMTTPVTWFITDVLAGTNLDVRNQTLYIAPVGPIQGDNLVTPIYFADFWGVVTYNPAKKQASLRITKTFGNKDIRIKKLISEPIGVPTSERRVTEIPEFVVKEGATLDLSPYWEKISGAVRHEAVLPRADQVDFIYVK